MADTFKILVPIGFSDQSLIALEQAMVFAKAIDQAELTLVTVIEDNSSFRKKLNLSKKDGAELKAEVNNKLQELAEKYSSQGVDIKTMVAKGTVYEEIGRITDLLDIHLVIMGTNGKPQNLRKRFIGSNAYRTATLVQPPVVVTKGIEVKSQIKTIIFPLVLDRRSKEKVGPAVKYARLFGASIKIVSINNNPDQAKILRGHLKQVENFIADHGISVSAELIEPESGNGVVRNTLKYAAENDGDLIIITEDSKQRDFTDYFLGTDVQAMMYHSDIPVMTITPSEVKWEAM